MFYDLVRIIIHGKLPQQRGSKVAVCVTGNTHVFWELVFDIGECFWHQLLEKYHIWLLPVTKQNNDYIKHTVVISLTACQVLRSVESKVFVQCDCNVMAPVSGGSLHTAWRIRGGEVLTRGGV